MPDSAHKLRQIEIVVSREVDVSHARQAALALAQALGFSRAAAYRLATAVSELGTNLVFHATHGGIISLSPLDAPGRVGLELVASDDGPGIADIDHAMCDGVSENGGLGSGLPGTRRLMDEFEISSRPGIGTRVVARLWR